MQLWLDYFILVAGRYTGSSWPFLAFRKILKFIFIYLRKWVSSLSLRMPKWTDKHFFWFIRSKRFVENWDLFSNKFFNIECVFLTTDAKRFADGFKDFRKYIFSCFLFNVFLWLFLFKLLHFCEVKLFFLSIEFYPNRKWSSFFSCEYSSLPDAKDSIETNLVFEKRNVHISRQLLVYLL